MSRNILIENCISELDSFFEASVYCEVNLENLDFQDEFGSKINGFSAINMLRDKPPGTFVVRDSNSFPGAFGLALKVSTPPPGVNPGKLCFIHE